MIDAKTVGATSTLVAKANPHRKRLYFVNNSIELMSLAPGNPAIAGSGVLLRASGGNHTDQPDPTHYIYKGPWFAICASGAMVLAITELYDNI